MKVIQWDKLWYDFPVLTISHHREQAVSFKTVDFPGIASIGMYSWVFFAERAKPSLDPAGIRTYTGREVEDKLRTVQHMYEWYS